MASDAVDTHDRNQPGQPERQDAERYRCRRRKPMRGKSQPGSRETTRLSPPERSDAIVATMLMATPAASARTANRNGLLASFRQPARQKRENHDGAEDAEQNEVGRRAEIEIAAGQKDEGDHREDHEQEKAVLALVGDLRDRHRDEQRREQQEDDVDAPALLDRIAAVDELTELRLDEGPAGAGRSAVGGRKAGLAVLARRTRRRRTAQSSSDQIDPDDEGATPRSWRSSSPATRRGWLASSRPARLAATGGGSGSTNVRADEGEVVRPAIAHRSTSAMRALNQFMNAEVSRLSVR